MNFHLKLLKVAIGSIIFCLGAGVVAWAQDLTYDRYAALLEENPESSTAKKIASHFLVYPFELVKWPVDQTLLYIEKHYLEKKVEWIYDKIQEQGIKPSGTIVSLGGLGGGLEVDFVRLTRLREHYPDLTTRGWYQWTNDVNMEVGSELGLQRIGETGFRTIGNFKYSNRPEEHFYGIGPDTSAGEGTSYRMESTDLETLFGYNWGPSLSADAKFGYHNVNITNGEDGGRGIIDTVFRPQTISGLAGDELIDLKLELQRDTRNRSENSTKGGLAKFVWSYYEGVDNSKARYFKYEAEMSRFLRLGADRRVLAFRLYGEHNDEIGDRYVPFHQMAKLGGYGAYPRLSRTLRGFDFNRFFDESSALMNLEYRYTIWEYRDFKLDSIVFWDEGQVFGEFSDFQFKDFRESYGLGFRVSLANVVLLTAVVAHGDEGTNLYVKTGAPF
ncbi:MAG: outer membrane protein assembly factor [Candidatus Omnitrophica bacterium]|nr:outer membrane protein assembly factor [Candidatus Omnitrophota bacterium]